MGGHAMEENGGNKNNKVNKNFVFNSHVTAVCFVIFQSAITAHHVNVATVCMCVCVMYRLRQITTTAEGR